MQLNVTEQFKAMIAGLEETGMTRTEIAGSVGVSRTHIWRIEVGTCKNPSFALGIRLNDLAVQRGVSPLTKKL